MEPYNKISIITLKYKIEDILIEENLSDRFECQICCNILINIVKPEVYQCKQGHLACTKCWTTSLLQKKECMICRDKVLSLSDLSRNRYLEQDFLDKLVVCPNSIYSIYKLNIGNDCIAISNDDQEQQQLQLCKQDKIKLKDLKNHMDNCEYQLLKCTLCNKRFRKNELNKHQDECRYTIKNCSSCNQSYTGSIEFHNTKCLKYQIKCTNCNLELKRIEKSDHILNDCPKTIIKCKFTSCGVSLERSKMVLHSSEHLDSLYSLVNSQTVKLEESDKKYNDLLEKYNKLEKLVLYLYPKVTKTTTTITTPIEVKQQLHTSSIYKNKFVISDFSNILKFYNHKQHLSKTFKTINPSLNFWFEIFPKGLARSQGHLSINLFSEDKEFEIKTNYKNTIINFKDDNLSIEANQSFTFNKDQSSYGIGDDKLVASRDITKEKGYLDNDGNLIFEVEIEILEVKPNSLKIQQKK